MITRALAVKVTVAGIAGAQPRRWLVSGRGLVWLLVVAALIGPGFAVRCWAADPTAGLPGFGSTFDPLAGIGASDAEPVAIAARVEKLPSGSNQLVVVASLGPGWHLYSLDQKPGGPKPTKIVVAGDSPLVPAGSFLAAPPPIKKTVSDVPGWEGLVIEEHAGEVTWTAPLKPNPAGTAATVHGSVSLQLCEDNACTPPQTIPFTAAAAGPGAEPLVKATLPPEPLRHLPERGHLAIEATVGDVTTSANTCTVWPLTIDLLPEQGWHLYAPQSDTKTEVGQGKPTILSLVPGAGLRVCDIVAQRPVLATDPELAAAGAVEGPVSLTVMIEVPGEQPAEGTGEKAAANRLELLVGFQTCSDTTCDPPWASRLVVDVPASGEAGRPRVSFGDGRYAEAAQKPATLSQAPPQLVGQPAASPPESVRAETGPVTATSPNGAPLSLPLALAAGLIGGLILNLMPCVLPVLGLKLMSFAQQSGRARREIFQLNLWYCAGLYAVFFVLATASVAANLGLAGSNLAWGEQFTSAGFNIVMASIVFAFALSFLGVWELPIPGFIGSTAGKVQTQEGPAGSFLKGVLSTVLATPCSGPFLGPVFGFTLTQPTPVTYAVFASIATGMALPYLLVGIFPALVKFVPKPGAWMETLKEVLGFVMLGTVVFLFTFLDKDYFVPTFALLVGIWAACWWVGRSQKTTGTASFGRWLQGAIVTAAVGASAFVVLGPGESVIEWQPFSRARLAELRQRGATVMVDFSADWCLTCKYNLNFAIETPRVKRALSDSQIVPMLADWTDGSPEIKAMLESLDSKSIPVLAFFPAEQPGLPAPAPIVLRDLVTEAQVLAAIQDAGGSKSLGPELRARSASLAPAAAH
jgi:thiol:disulfide interchange protein